MQSLVAIWEQKAQPSEEKNVGLCNAYYIIVLTYIYIIGHYNPSARKVDLVSHTAYVVYVNFIQK